MHGIHLNYSDLVTEKAGMPCTTGVHLRIVELQPIKILAMRCIGAYENLFNGCSRLFEIIENWCGPESLQGIHGLWLDDPVSTPTQDFRFDCAFSVSAQAEAPPGTRWEVTTAGTCLSTRHVGDYGAGLAAASRGAATATPH